MHYPCLDLTIAVPVRNEEINLGICLTAIGSDFARNVVVIDSSSTDSTASVALDHGAELVNFEWDGHFPKKRNWFLRNHQPASKWILFLDADEILSPAVKAEIAAILPSTKNQGFLLSYTNYFMGRRLRGGYPLRKLALFKAGEVEFEFIDEQRWSQSDMEVHEHPIVVGSVGLIRNRIDHRDLRGIDNYIAKHNQYAAWEAHRLFSYRHSSPTRTDWRFHQRLKYFLVASPWGGLFFFLGSYFLMGGWRDGSTGLAFCLLKAGYFTQIACRLEELELRA